MEREPNWKIETELFSNCFAEHDEAGNYTDVCCNRSSQTYVLADIETYTAIALYANITPIPCYEKDLYINNMCDRGDGSLKVMYK